MKTKIDADQFRIPPGRKVDLRKQPTLVRPYYDSKAHYQELLERHVGELRELQNRLYASNQWSVLLIFQAMDAAGKDGVIKHVMSGVNPQGCQVFSFKHPSDEELDHDFLWRTTRNLPERGRIGIFNRSYYEEVLVVRVHPQILAGQNLPEKHAKSETVWERRFQSIASLEKHLACNGTKVVKFYLHLSKEEQRKRFLSRIDDPEKNWKFADADVKERGFWKDYMRAYEECLAATSTRDSPWYVVPADDKMNTRLIVSRVVADTMRGLGLAYPKIDAARRKQLKAIRKQLT
jgi:PPK2 family polyphosphate:nucleotide phosphotransferase